MLIMPYCVDIDISFINWNHESWIIWVDKVILIYLGGWGYTQKKKRNLKAGMRYLTKVRSMNLLKNESWKYHILNEKQVEANS